MSITLPKIIGYSQAIPPVERSPFCHGDHRGSHGFNPFLKKGNHTAGARDRKAGAKWGGDYPASLELLSRQSCPPRCSTARRPLPCSQSIGLAGEVKHRVTAGLSPGTLATPTPLHSLQGGRSDVAPLTLEATEPVTKEEQTHFDTGSLIDMYL